jgi:tetratricopeptide (TPR) repeat protein
MQTNFLEEFELRKALTQYQEAIKLDPNNAGPFNGLAGAYAGLGDFVTAINYYEKAIELDPNQAGPFNGIGSAYLALGNSEKAIEYFKKATKLDPNEVSSWYYLGSAHLALKQYENALAVFKDALRIHKDNAFIINGLALSRYNIQKTAKPVTTLRSSNIKPSFRL